MAMYAEAEQVNQIIQGNHRIVIVQADNPDADSLGSALALEQILGEMGKEPLLYCGVDIPTYLRYMPGWDRVQKMLPQGFEASIIVDASTLTLFQHLIDSGQRGWLAGKPCVVLDHHHEVQNNIDFANVTINDASRASTGELIYLLAKQLNWPSDNISRQAIMSSILGDTQGLTNQLASAETYRVMAELIESGVNRAALEEMRREFGKMEPEIYKYKAALIEHTELTADNRIACVTVPQVEINTFSPLYNPGPLIQGDMLQIKDVQVAIVFKQYDDGKTTAAIRCNPRAGIAAELAEHFGGGGHAFAGGFKIEGGRPFNEIKSDCISFASALLAKLEQGNNDEALQHAQSKN